FGNTLWEPDFDIIIKELTKSDGRIHLMGRYDHHDLWKVMNGIDMMVVPSSTLESFGLVVIESLAYGIPVIASDIVGSSYEYLNHGVNGFIFPIYAPATLTEIISKISKDPSIISRLRDNIVRPPQIEEEAFHVESLYHQLLH
ncbi:MAG: glycosyltransferase, partial [Thermodesulfobacteriota bacterium]